MGRTDWLWCGVAHQTGARCDAIGANVRNRHHRLRVALKLPDHRACEEENISGFRSCKRVGDPFFRECAPAATFQIRRDESSEPERIAPGKEGG